MRGKRPDTLRTIVMEKVTFPCSVPGNSKDNYSGTGEHGRDVNTDSWPMDHTPVG